VQHNRGGKKEASWGEGINVGTEQQNNWAGPTGRPAAVKKYAGKRKKASREDDAPITRPERCVRKNRIINPVGIKEGGTENLKLSP